jgi:hypothetical protein
LPASPHDLLRKVILRHTAIGSAGNLRRCSGYPGEGVRVGATAAATAA